MKKNVQAENHSNIIQENSTYLVSAYQAKIKFSL